jgi:hypothetical protein
MKDQGLNEKIRLVEMSDPAAKNLDEAFHNMWVIALSTRCTKPLHHISINPMKGERLTDKQVLAIVERCEQKYGYKMFHHQRVIVEHVKDGRQHFHVIWNRVSLYTGRPVWPGHHWKKSKQVCREMEKELGLQRPTPRSAKHTSTKAASVGKRSRLSGHYSSLKALRTVANQPRSLLPAISAKPSRPSGVRPLPFLRERRGKDENIPSSKKQRFRRPEWESAELLAWAWENGRLDILAQYGIYVSPDYFEP